MVPRTGWFSDRTVCYLAAGRPAVVEDTGIGEWLATDSGVLTFATLDEAVAAVESVAAHYAVHVAAAREIAREYFCAERVLDRVMTISMAGT